MVRCLYMGLGDGRYKDEVVEGEAQGGEVGEAGREIVLGQIVLHEIQHLEISKGHVWGHLEKSANSS